MKMKHIFFIITALSLSGCSDFLDVTPNDKQTAKQLYSTRGGFYIASNGIYNGLASEDLYGRVMTYEAIDIISKRYVVNSSNQYLYGLINYNYSALMVQPVIDKIWEDSYALIMACNLLIENTRKQTGILNRTESDIMEGEALAVRAFLHFDMLRLFGPRWNDNPGELSIPYNESSQVMILPLLPFSTVVDNIIRDLDNAERLLAKDPVITGGAMASEEANESVQLRYRQFRFNYYAVKALKARVYLYAGRKPEALNEAKALLNDADVNRHFPPVDPGKLLANYTNPDRVFSSEILTGIYTKKRDAAFTDYFSPEAPRRNFLQPYSGFVTDYLFALGYTGSFESDQDYRFQSQWEVASGVGMTGHIFTKYKPIEQPDDDEDSEYFYSRMISLLRLSEVYYIAAECETDQTEAFKWLNEMRKRRGLAEVTAQDWGSNLQTLISNEYLREFYGEGQAFFYFKRLAVNQFYENAAASYSGASYRDAAYRPSLPEGEMKSK